LVKTHNDQRVTDCANKCFSILNKSHNSIRCKQSTQCRNSLFFYQYSQDLWDKQKYVTSCLLGQMAY